MIIESWIAVMIFVGFIVLCGIALIGWIYEGEKLNKAEEEIKALLYENRELSEKIAYRNALDNIRTANKHYEESKKND